MLKKLSLIVLLVSHISSLQADWSSFWGALLGAIIGSSANSPQNPSQQVQIAVTSAPAIHTNGRKMCASDCDTRCEVNLPCGHCMCNSCLRGARDNALRDKTNLVCRACGKTVEDYNVAAQAQALNNIKQAPSAPPAVRVNDQAVLCAFGCDSRCEVKLNCGHCMCKSCLRSSIAKDQRAAGGGEPYVICPNPNCADMLTADVIRKAK